VFVLIKKSIKSIKERGFKNFLLAVKEYLKRFFITTPIFRTVYYKLKKKLNPAGFLVVNSQGSKIMVNLAGEDINRDLIIHKGLREPECTKIIKQELKKGMRVIDIGANIGYYALCEAKMVGGEGKVFAIEPEPKNFKALNKNISLNNYSNIRTFQCAVGDKSGKTPFYISDKSNWHTAGKLKESRNIKIIDQIEIDMVTLDDFAKNREPINFVRMDVEGFEPFILDGAKNLLSQNSPMKLFIEIHNPFIKENGRNTEEMFNFLANLNFKLNYIVKQSLNISPSSIYRRFKEGPIVFSEKSVKYKKLLKEALQDPKINKILMNESFYSVFLEKSVV